jgi:hypothetical protein
MGSVYADLSAPSPASARIILARSDETQAGVLNSPARIRIDGTHIADLPLGGCQIHEVEPGTRVLMLDIEGGVGFSGGAHEMEIDLPAGSERGVERAIADKKNDGLYEFVLLAQREAFTLFGNCRFMADPRLD